MSVYDIRLDLMNLKVSPNITYQDIQKWCSPAEINAAGRYKTKDFYYVIPKDYWSYCQLLGKLSQLRSHSAGKLGKSLVFARPVLEKRHLCPYNSILGSAEMGVKQTNYVEYPHYVKVGNLPLDTTKDKLRQFLSSYDAHIEDIQFVKMKNSMTAFVGFSFVYQAFLALFNSGRVINKNHVVMVKKFRIYG